jgi:acyl-CoA synthetase (NDP forming)
VETLSRIESYLTQISDQFPAADMPVSPLKMNEEEVYRLCDILGISRCPSVFLSREFTEEEMREWAGDALSLAGDQGRILLKIVGREILHKTDVGGVKIVPVGPDCDSAALAESVARMYQELDDGGLKDSVEGVLAGAFVPHYANRPGQEILLSLRQDPAFGPCVVIGIGGTLTEWYGKGSSGASTLILPAVGLERENVIAALECHPMLNILCVPSRLYPRAPIPAAELADTILKLAEVGRYCSANGDSGWILEEIEINPLVVSEGHLVALDGVGSFSVRAEREIGRPLAKITNLLEPRSAVVFGASARGANPGRIILDNLNRAAGLDRGRLYAVHPKEERIGDVPCFQSVGDLPEKCDLAVVSIPAQGAVDAIRELVDQDKAESIILIPGGFAEAGETVLAEAIEDTLAVGHSRPGGGPVMVGGNCLGIVSRDNYNTFFLPDYKLAYRPGYGENLALVSQSGAYLVTFASNYDGLIHPRASISFGNQMDLTVSDFLEHFLEVPEVDVIACYVEGFRDSDGQRFIELARRAVQVGKKVIVYKAGKTPLGAKAAASHTASLAGDYAVAEACLLQSGVIVADTLSRFEDAIKAFTLLGRRPVGQKRVGIISNAGFECSTVTDNLGELVLANFDPVTQGVLDEALPGFAHRTNPIDCTPMTGTEAFAASCRAILDSPAVDVAILASVPVTPSLDNLPADPGNVHSEDLTGPNSQPSKMIEIISASSKPAVVVVDSGRIYDPMCRMIEKAGIPVFRKIDRAALALNSYCRAEGALR